MRRHALIAGLALALVLESAAHGQGRIALVDRIVAVVNSDVVTASELNERVASAVRELRRQGTPPPEPGVLEKQMLERLILEKAQLQLARDTGLRVDEVQIDRAIERIAETNKLTLLAFRKALEADGISFERFREDLRLQIVLTRLREREVEDKIQVGDSEIDLYLAEATGDADSKAASPGAEYNLAHILVRLPEQAAPERLEQARARAEKVVAEARSGADFAKLAASYSDGGDALQGGAMGWRQQDRLPEIFAAALKELRPGEVTGVLRSPAGFHVLKMLDRRGASAAIGGAPVTQTHARHILVRTNEIVSEADARRRLADLRERVVTGGANFADLARLHSEDGSAARGGDLDWVYPGDTVPDFERAMNALKPGEISEAVKTPFGWHLIQVLERRTADVSAERRRLMARQALRDRKVDEAYQEWLRQLRDRTYVELRLEER
jgi:peptidyl-prolyl cis-trans isomerase SurA